MNEISEKEYKSLLVNMLVQVDVLCRKNNIRYMLFYGCLLGAVRHKGFIPWDDDIDIVVSRDDYYKLKEVIQESSQNLTFICPESSSDTIFPFGKICNSETELYENNFRHVKGYGAYIDVFPFDYLPNDEKKRNRLRKKYQIIEKINVHAARTGYVRVNSKKENLLKWCAFTFSKAFNPSKLTKWLNSKCKELSFEKTKYVGIPWGFLNECFLVELFEEISEVEFEGHMVLAPANTESVLRQLYGDYMKLPPEEKRVSNHMFSCYWKRGMNREI